MLRGYMKQIDARKKSVLIIPDTHCPYQHQDWLRFLTATQKQYQTKLALHLGDELDNHSLSFHDHDSDLYSAGDELNKAIELLHELEAMFPKLLLCDSNHGSLAIRRFKKNGIPMKYIRTLQEIYGTPGWSWNEDYIIKTVSGDIYVCHGKSATYGKLCKEVGMSSIQGHFHGKFEITYHHSVTATRWNMITGCLINRESLAFAYGKNHIPKPILGAGVITDAGLPLLIKMDLTKDGRWTGKI